MIRYLFAAVMGAMASLLFLFFLWIGSIGVGLEYTYIEVIKDSYIFICGVAFSSPLLLVAVENNSSNTGNKKEDNPKGI